LTGDGGWAGLDREVSAKLAGRAIPVVGLDSLSYFWNKRTPEETARDVAAVIGHYSAAWHKRRVILIGYSFGADVMPFVVNRLPADARAQLKLVTMIVPSLRADFEFHVAEWAGLDVGESAPTLPEMRKTKGTRTLCLYGVDEKESLCPLLGPLAKVVGLPGGHHAGGDYDRLANEILTAAE
jgi:type IV secretory pathway VirJ component